jgi:hypothetical protein
MQMRFNDQGADGGVWLERQPEAAGLAAPLPETFVHAFCTMPIKDP